MSLKDWLRNGWLSEHTTSPEEISDLLGVCDRDLKDCQAPGLSTDWRFNIAYNAAMQACAAALFVSGYRATREAHHYQVIHSLEFTLGASAVMIRQLDAFRKKRNIGEYEAAGKISSQEATEMVKLASALRARVEEWIRQTRPELLP